jgi:histidine kinase/DNA gyrase B/HSP90-like ATPase
MYIDPMSIFREYIQNAADSIDEARRTGLLGTIDPGQVTINVDAATRTIKIRDNGVGLPPEDFAVRLTAFGASTKRGKNARGFRGVGRLAGLGYCQELIFRSRVGGVSHMNEIRWDCRRLRKLLRGADFNGHLDNLVQETVEIRRVEGRGWPDRFFEVELVGVIRHRNDQLLNAIAIEEYLSEVGPVPFAPEFQYGAEIVAALKAQVDLGNIEIYVNGAQNPIYRPHRNTLKIGPERIELYTEIEFVQIPAVDGEIAAIGWILHHGYAGALPANTHVKGLRLRSGNIQIGGDNLLEDIFPESRFNSWAVGELHMLDQRLVQNGRRDHFEQNVHLFNLLNHMSPIAGEISRRCRASSVQRRYLKDFERYQMQVNNKVAILRQRSLGKIDRARVVHEIEELLGLMDRIAALDQLDANTRDALSKNVRGLHRSIESLLRNASKKTALAHLPPPKRRAYEQILALIYECSPNQSAAKVLVDKILTKLK